MNVILTYDLSGSNGPVKSTMIANGYSKTFISNGNIINLPETTLFHPHKTPSQALIDIQNSARNHGVRVTRAIATELFGTIWDALPGEVLR